MHNYYDVTINYDRVWDVYEKSYAFVYGKGLEGKTIINVLCYPRKTLKVLSEYRKQFVV